jgi:hypothetical protein
MDNTPRILIPVQTGLRRRRDALPYVVGGIWFTGELPIGDFESVALPQLPISGDNPTLPSAEASSPLLEGSRGNLDMVQQ